MSELAELEHLSLVSKICIELDNHLGINDKDLAEFIIDLAEKNTTIESFRKVLSENGADFPDSFVSSLMRIIQLMKPVKPGDGGAGSSAAFSTDHMAMKFPGLALPNQSQKEMNVADDMFAELEALAPSTSTAEDKKDVKKEERKEEKMTVKTEDKKRERSTERSRHRDRSRDRSRDRKRRSTSRDHKRRSTSRDRKRRSPSRDRKRRRSRSRSGGRQKRERSRSREKRRDRSRSRERKRERSRSRDRNRRNRSGSRDNRRQSQSPSKSAPMPEDPEAGGIYQGRVANITNFGCFVQLMGLRKRWEGLVHISQLRAEGKVNDVTEVVARGANVRVKVMSVAGQKVSLSMKEVCQTTGRDLNPASHAHLKDDGHGSNTERAGGTSMLQLQGGDNNEEDQTRKRVTRISSPERWEIKQMISSGVIDRSELPDFDEETGLLPKDEDNEADIEIEIVEEEPPFLQGHGRALHDLSPVRIVKNPDGSLAQAAMMQSALAKERREVKMYQREQEMDSVPSNLNKNWIDPLPDGKAKLTFTPISNVLTCILLICYHRGQSSTGGERSWYRNDASGDSRVEETRNRRQKVIVRTEN